MKSFLKRHQKLHIWLLIDICLVASFFLFRGNRQWMNWLTERVTTPMKQAIGRMCYLTEISVMEVLVYSPDWIVQRFIVVNGAEYIRHWHSANTWSDWKTNIDSGNIGSQSVNYATSAGTATNVAWSGVTSKPSYYDAKAIKSITRSGTTFTYTCMDGTTGTFTQQDNNTDTKVTNTLATTTKAYVTGTTSATTNTSTQVFDTGVYLDTTAGQLTATTFNGTTFKGSGVATVSEVETYLGI
jgi:hypothetical protein